VLQRAPVETITIPSGASGILYADASESRAVAVYVPEADVLWFAAATDELDGVTSPGVAAAPLHTLPDTRHRWIAYSAVSTSRFQDYFDTPGLDFTRRSEPLVVDMPSSSRPASPDIAYVLPTFGWDRNLETSVKSSVRHGNGLRIYLNRPWYSSGDDELLGVVLWPETRPDPDDSARERYKPYFTQWGADPIWSAGDLDAVPRTYHFPDAAATATALALDEVALDVDVAAHDVHFDETRKLWYCDVQLDQTRSYAPFVRLALARYQPHSLPGVELSRVALADYAQLTPTRSAVLMLDPFDSLHARLHVGGLAPAEPTRARIEVTVEERRRPALHTDLDWQPAPVTDVQVVEDAPAPAQPDAALWAGTISFAREPGQGLYRVVVREYETIEIETPRGQRQRYGERLVYAETFAYDVP
jgi:hypothetical protein